jgi:hypothetical protein
MNLTSHARRIIVNRTWALTLMLVAVLGVVGDRQVACAQSPIIAVGPPSFQSIAGPSMEDEILNRMTVLGPREPGDFEQLARLSELRSISTLAGVQNDLRGSVAGAQLESENLALRNATDSFDQASRNLPADSQNLAWSQSLLTNTQAAFDRMNSSLGGLPALSPRGAFYLQGISRILPLQEAGLQMIEAENVPRAGLTAVRRVNLAELREQARLLARELGELTQEIKQSQANPSDRETAVTELSRFLELISGFDRMLDFGPTLPEITESFRLLIRGAWSAKATVVRVASAEAWHPLHDRLAAICSAVRIPRAPGSRAAVRPLSPRTTDLLAMIDRAGALVTAAVSAQQPPVGNEPPASRLADQARRLQVKLIVLRQHVLTGDSIDELGGGLAEIEALSQQLVAREQPAPTLFRGGRSERTYSFKQVDQMIKRLRGLLAG